LDDIGAPQRNPTFISEDNQRAIAIARNPVAHGRTKHIDIRHHFVREAVLSNVTQVTYCENQNMLADILTNSLPRTRVEKLRNMSLCAKSYFHGGLHFSCPNELVRIAPVTTV